MQDKLLVNNILKWLASYLAFVLLSIILFLPVLGKSFASDDFSVLYRIVHEQNFLLQGFFRQLSDITLYTSYIVGGINPVYYNAVNIIIHASSCFVLYRLCLSGNFLTINHRHFFAGTASILFLIYPFHNEAVIWAIGRGIVLSGFFGILSLRVVFLEMSPGKKYLLSCIFYFIGLCGYETIIPLPAIILLFVYSRDKSFKALLPAAAGYIAVLMSNLLIRIQISGALLGQYGRSMFTSSPRAYAVKLFKAAGRSLLPPAGFSLLLAVLFACIVIAIVFISIYLVKKKRYLLQDYAQVSAVFFISMVIPAMFGLSTKTYEGDRVLYFSSFFLSVWIAYLLSMVASKKLRLFGGMTIAFYFIFFFYQNIFIWRQSGRMVENIIASVASMKKGTGKRYLLDMPEAYTGTPVFRNGFTKALLIKGIDTSGLQVVNFLAIEKNTGLQQIIPVTQNNRVFIPPYTSIANNLITAQKSYDDRTVIAINCNSNDSIYYWNGRSFILLNR